MLGTTPAVRYDGGTKTMDWCSHQDHGPYSTVVNDLSLKLVVPRIATAFDMEGCVTGRSGPVGPYLWTLCVGFCGTEAQSLRRLWLDCGALWSCACTDPCRVPARETRALASSLGSSLNVALDFRRRAGSA